MNAKNELIISAAASDQADLAPILDDLDSYVEVSDRPSSGRHCPHSCRKPRLASAAVARDDIILDNGDIVYIRSRDAGLHRRTGRATGFPSLATDPTLGAMPWRQVDAWRPAATSTDSAAASGRSSRQRVLVIRTINGRQQAIEIDAQALPIPAGESSSAQASCLNTARRKSSRTRSSLRSGSTLAQFY